MGLGDILAQIHGPTNFQALGVRGIPTMQPGAVRGIAPQGLPPVASLNTNVQLPQINMPNMSGAGGGGPLAALSNALQQGGDFHSGAGMQFAQAPQRGGGLGAILSILASM